MNTVCSNFLGFYLESGNFNVTCRQDYTWSPATFICAKRECKKPLVVDNADIIGTDFHFGGSITYECKPGELLNALSLIFKIKNFYLLILYLCYIQ